MVDISVLSAKYTVVDNCFTNLNPNHLNLNHEQTAIVRILQLISIVPVKLVTLNFKNEITISLISMRMKMKIFTS